MRWKWILAVAGGVIVVLIVAVYIILSTYNFNYLKPYITRTAKEATGRELTLGGDIHLKIGLTPALVVDDVKFQNAPWGSRPNLAKIKRFEVQVALIPLISGNVELKRLILVEPDILIETNASGKSNLEFEKEKEEAPPKPKEETPAPGKGKLPALTFNEVKITRGVVTYLDGRTHKRISTAIDSLTASSTGPESPIKLKLKGAYQDEPLEVEGSFGPLTALTTSGKPCAINLETKAFGATLNSDGTIKDVANARGIELRFAMKGDDLAALGKASGKELPLKGPYEFSGLLTDPAPKTYKISSLKALVAGNDLSGTVEVSLAGARPRISATLASQKMDIRSMLEKSPGKQAAKTTEKATEKTTEKTAEKTSKPSVQLERVFPDDPLPLDGLGLVDANAKIQVTQLLLPRLALNNLSADLNLKDSHLSVRPLKAAVGGGSLEGHIDLQAQGKTGILTAVLKVDQLDVGRMLKELQIREAVEGRLDADMNITGRGSSVAGLMGGLDGKTVMVMKNGKVDSKYIDLLGGGLGSNIFGLLGFARQESQSVALNCFVSGFNIKDGLADTTALVIDTDRVSVVGDGQINLKDERLNIALVPSPKQGVGTSATGKITAGLGEFAKAFRLVGTLAKPALGIDTTQAALTAGKMAAGFAAFGPAGLTSALVGGTGGTQSGENLCSAALEAAKKGTKMSGGGKTEQKGTEPAPTQDLQQGIKDLRKQLKKFFSQ
jgi:AsmA family protein